MSYAEICWNALNVWQVTGLWPLQLQVRSGAASSKSIDIQNPRWNRSLLQLRLLRLLKLLRLLLCNCLNSLTNSYKQLQLRPCGLDLIWHHTRRAGAASKSQRVKERSDRSWAKLGLWGLCPMSSKIIEVRIEVSKLETAPDCTVQISQSVRLAVKGAAE